VQGGAIGVLDRLTDSIRLLLAAIARNDRLPGNPVVVLVKDTREGQAQSRIGRIDDGLDDWRRCYACLTEKV
jgi:hypothetical protein